MELYPIRIDIVYPPLPSAVTPSSDDASTTTNNTQPPSLPPIIRIIDTLMIDPKSLLLNTDIENRTTVFTQWAHSIISDAFVVGVTKKVVAEIAQITTDSNAVPNTTTSSSSATLVPDPKRKTEFIGRFALIDTNATTNIATASIHDTITIYDSLLQQALLQIHTQSNTIQQYEHMIQQYQNQHHNNSSKGGMKNTQIPITLRLELPSRDNNNNNNTIPPVRYHDDFIWDPFLLSCDSPLIMILQIATSIVNDLQLSHDTIPIIIMNILEQTIQFLNNNNNTTTFNRPNSNDDDMMIEDDEGIQMGPPILLSSFDKQNEMVARTTAAWEISSTIHQTNQIHLETTLISRSHQ